MERKAEQMFWFNALALSVFSWLGMDIFSATTMIAMNFWYAVILYAKRKGGAQ